VALGTLAWTGHAGASEAGLGLFHCISDILHLLAAATWLGALVLFLAAALRGGEGDGLARRLENFARTGSVIVLVLLVTGIANTAIITGGQIDFAMPWFKLLAAKIGLFTLMLALAAGNRWRLAPALAEHRPGSLRSIRLSLLLETAAGCAIIAIVAALGTLTPM
jgi:putative copper resistance protein D